MLAILISVGMNEVLHSVDMNKVSISSYMAHIRVGVDQFFFVILLKSIFRPFESNLTSTWSWLKKYFDSETGSDHDTISYSSSS